jgi:hypothetical protein
MSERMNIMYDCRKEKAEDIEYEKIIDDGGYYYSEKSHSHLMVGHCRTGVPVCKTQAPLASRLLEHFYFRCTYDTTKKAVLSLDWFTNGTHLLYVPVQARGSLLDLITHNTIIYYSRESCFIK